MKWKMKGHLIKDKPHISEEFSEEQWKTRVPVDFMESSHKPTICPHQPIFKAAEDAVYFVVFGLVYTYVCSKPSFDFHKNNDDCSVFPPITSNNCCEWVTFYFC